MSFWRSRLPVAFDVYGAGHTPPDDDASSASPRSQFCSASCLSVAPRATSRPVPRSEPISDEKLSSPRALRTASAAPTSRRARDIFVAWESVVGEG